MIQAQRAIVALVLLAACAAPPAPLASLGADPARDRVVTIPVSGEDGTVTPIQTRICRPDAPGPAPLVVINHGSPPSAAERPRMQLRRCDEEATQWFLRRGFVVAFPLRRGYGATGGPAPESAPSCDSQDNVRSGLETARDIAAVVTQLTALPFIRPGKTVIVGQSAGGWGTVAYDSVPHPGVLALVSMAGGRGGHYHLQPNQNCHPERLVDAAARFGATASTPMLWIFTANDSYFAPPLAAAMHAAFTGAGGHAEFDQLGPYAADGHTLFFGRGGAPIWGPLVERYLKERDALP